MTKREREREREREGKREGKRERERITVKKIERNFKRLEELTLYSAVCQE